jgi:hypothetical protein
MKTFLSYVNTQTAGAPDVCSLLLRFYIAFSVCKKISRQVKEKMKTLTQEILFVSG